MTAVPLAPAAPVTVVRSPAGTVLARRAARLERLRADHPFGDFLGFVGRIVAIQAQLAQPRLAGRDASWPQQAVRVAREIAASGAFSAKVGTGFANESAIAQKLRASDRFNQDGGCSSDLPPETHAAAAATAALGERDIAAIAARWLDRTPAAADIPALPFVLAGLQLARMAVAAPGLAHEAVWGRCPACGGPPLVATLDVAGESEGVRHVHCALCAATWRVERLRCLACGGEGSARIFALDGDDRPVKAEACDSCGHYLKTFAPVGLDGFEALADDLATFDLDLRLAGDGFSRVTANPFLLVT